jgi:hypothetical protein
MTVASKCNDLSDAPFCAEMSTCAICGLLLASSLLLIGDPDNSYCTRRSDAALAVFDRMSALRPRTVEIETPIFGNWYRRKPAGEL